ncbi:hypothetical protein GCM10029976_087670 [Kribbella albertanoniae]
MGAEGAVGEAAERTRASAPRTVADASTATSTESKAQALQAKAGNSAFNGVGPWLRENAKPALDALNESPPDFETALLTLNRFSTEDIVAVFRGAGGPKRVALGKYLEAGNLPAVDVPRFVLAWKMATGPGAAAARGNRLHDMIRGGHLQDAYELLNPLSAADQEKALAMLDPAHWDELANGLEKAAGVDVPWLATLLAGVRGAPVTSTMTALGWLNGQEAAAGAAWAAGQPDDRLSFMLRPRTLKAAGQVGAERIRAMLIAGQVRRIGDEVDPVQAAKVEAALATLPADQRNAIRTYLGIPVPTIAEASAETSTRAFTKEKEYKAPSDNTEQSCQNLFGQSYAELLASMQEVSAFGVKATVHPQLAAALLRADAIARQKIAATEGRPVEASDWRISDMQGLQFGSHGFHTFGLAVDLNYKTMPYLMNEGAYDTIPREGPLDVKLRRIYRRIAWLMLGRESVIPGVIPKGGGTRSYPALAAESQAMQAYFALRGNPAGLKSKLEERDEAAVKIIFDGAPGDRATVLPGLLDTDHDQLSAAPEVNPALPATARPMDSPFDPKKGHTDPSGGFMTIRQEIHDALKEADPAIRWGGTDFGEESGDLMHFDLGKGISYDKKSKTYSRKKS